jgi:hypothetical protein
VLEQDPAAELRLMAAQFFSKALEVESDWLTASQQAGSDERGQLP